MNIREAENKLFDKWRTKYSEVSFVIDGCPNPNIYTKEERKVVQVLKDGNLGEPNPSDSFGDRTYDQRDELENNPTQWWSTIATWSYFLKTPSKTWQHVQDFVTNT